MERKYYLNVLRLIATLSVVLLHTSAGVLDNSLAPSEYEFLYSYFKLLNQFAVPVFVMISGYLFLNPSKSINYGLLFSKYVRRIVFALFIFGIPMCILESTFWGENIFRAFDNFLRGHSWAHMWYLYMLIGLYLLTPIFRPVIVNSSIKDIKIGLCLLFVLSSLLPTLNIYGISVSSYLILPPYIFLYLLGYYLGDLEKNNFSIRFLFGLLFIFLILTCFRVLYSMPGNSYSDVIVIFGASVVFLLFKKRKSKLEYSKLSI